MSDHTNIHGEKFTDADLIAAGQDWGETPSALERYGHHLEHCSALRRPLAVVTRDTEACSCGFAHALKAKAEADATIQRVRQLVEKWREIGGRPQRPTGFLICADDLERALLPPAAGETR